MSEIQKMSEILPKIAVAPGMLQQQPLSQQEASTTTSLGFMHEPINTFTTFTAKATTTWTFTSTRLTDRLHRQHQLTTVVDIDIAIQTTDDHNTHY